VSRILWLGNPPWLPSGYGEQTALFVPRIRDLGHEVAVLCNWGLHGQVTNWNGIPCYPCDGLFGTRNLPTYVDALQVDQVLGLFDAWVVKPDMWPDELQIGLWAPVDHYPLPPKVNEVLANRRVTPIAMSRFGEQMMQAEGLEPLYVPHGVDTDVFRPMPEIRAQVRDGLGLPQDAFVVGMVAANTSAPHLPRKSFPQALLAFTEFARTHDDACLYMHTDFAPQGVGMDLNVVADLCRCPAGRIKYPDPASIELGIPREVVACTYQAFDVLLNPSMGEGFGLPILEAQACGVPVIVSDHSAMTELCGAGWLVDGDAWLDYTQQSWFINPSVGSIVDALDDAYEAQSDEQLRDRAVAFTAAYEADTVTETYWKPALARLLDRERVAA